MTASSSRAGRTGVLVLAAGKGTRMHSDKPKVLQTMLEEPMLHYVLDATADLAGKDATWTVIGHGADMVRSAVGDERTQFIEQKEQLGTGHALATAWPELKAAGVSHVLVVNGDTPRVSGSVLQGFVEKSMTFGADLAFITLTPPDAGAFGRVVRKNGRVTAIIEAKDYDESRFGPCPREINAGIYCIRAAVLDSLLPRLGNANKSGEFYITDLVEFAVADGLVVLGAEAGDDMNLLGVNTPGELVAAEEAERARIVAGWLAAGVLIHNADQVRISPRAVLEPGAELTGPLEIYGKSVLRAGSRVDSHSRMTDSSVDSGAVVRSFCHLEGATIGPDCVVGPFSRMRPGAVLEEGAHVGSFVEMKKSRLRKGAKANHLAYIGDADVGERVNIGAGVITCNYDGKNKHATVIGDDAFIGSNASLVAPVTVGAGALVGAGSVITKNVAEKTLALGRARQTELPLRKK